MNIKLQRIVAQVLPFFILGITIAFAIAIFIVFSYLLLWGIFIGAVIWAAALIKNYFSPKPAVVKNEQGRVIEHDE